MVRYTDRCLRGDFPARDFLHPYLHLAGRVGGEIRQAPAVSTKGGTERADRLVRDRARLTAGSRNHPDAAALFAHRPARHEGDLFAVGLPDGIANEPTWDTGDRKL